MFPRSGTCVSWPAAASWAALGPGRRDAAPSGSPAAASPGESSAATGRERGGDLIVGGINLRRRRLKGCRQHESARCPRFKLIVVSCARSPWRMSDRWSLHSLTAQRRDGGSEPFILTCAKLRLKKIQSVCGEKKVVTDIFHR